MIFIECYGKNVYIDKEHVGYISPDGDFFADMSAEQEMQELFT